jgi:hypothetical protein
MFGYPESHISCHSDSHEKSCRVAEALHAKVRVIFEPEKKGAGMRVAEAGLTYHPKRSKAKRT